MIFSNLIQKFRDHKQHRANVEEFKQSVLNSVASGRLTDARKQELAALQENLGVEFSDLERIRVDIFNLAFDHALDRGALPSDNAWNLEDLRKYLCLEPGDLPAATINKMCRANKLFEIRNGPLPPLRIANLVLLKGEDAFWAEYGTLYEEKVISRHYEGGSSGVSLHICKGVNYRVGNSRGHIVSETGHVPVSNGALIITNHRLIFSGDDKSFATKFEKLININAAVNGFRFSESGRQKGRAIVFNEKNGDLFVEALNRVMNA